MVYGNKYEYGKMYKKNNNISFEFVAQVLQILHCFFKERDLYCAVFL